MSGSGTAGADRSLRTEPRRPAAPGGGEWPYRVTLCLMGVLVAYAVSWAVVILATLAGNGPARWFGIDIGNLTRETPLLVYVLFFGQVALFLMALASLVGRRRVTLWIFAAGAGTHAAMWLTMTASTYYSGELGYGVLMLEAMIALGLILARRRNQLR